MAMEGGRGKEDTSWKNLENCGKRAVRVVCGSILPL